ncbi:MAG TPA: response regulator transcription factor [Acidimicrobiales bacterium]|jgi:two-component system KDP operon response regulator KdpE|nr:response regulator transcription factor [Acidimicrobiales bacterium]
MARVLVVDDDRGLCQILRIGLGARGYDVAVARSGAQGLAEAASRAPDVVVLDLGLDDLDGLEVCRRLRQWSSVPIIVLSAAGAEERKVAALDGGADDFVTKPFGMAELEARLRVALRHHPPREGAPSEVRVGPLTLDAARYEARLDGVLLDLTAREFEFLAYLARHAGRICTKQMILRDVWGPGYGDESNYLRVYAHRLRRKLAGSTVALRTRPGIGYELDAE